MNKLITQRINANMHKSIELAISRFEGNDITAIVVSVNGPIFLILMIILMSFIVSFYAGT